VDTLPRPGETGIANTYTLLPGGKGANQAIAAALAGGDVVMCGCIGDDAAGILARLAFKKAGVRCDGLRTVQTPTGLAFVWVDASGENVITIARNANGDTRANHVPEALLKRGGHALVQMEVPVPENWAFLARARAAGTTTVCNLAPYQPIPATAWPSVDWLIVNAHEAAALLGSAQATPSTQALRDLVACHHTNIVVTEGADGARAVTREGAWQVRALDITPVDTTGAGDAFVGAFVSRLDAGDKAAEALRYASVASGLACLQVGAQSALPNHADVQTALHRVASPQTLN
jgi:ribokinase